MLRNWHPTPSSSNVAGFGFDEDTKEIVVAFKNGGMYAYDVATTVFETFELASSAGKFVNEVFKQGGVKVRKIDGPTIPAISQIEQAIQKEGGVDPASS